MFYFFELGENHNSFSQITASDTDNTKGTNGKEFYAMPNIINQPLPQIMSITFAFHSELVYCPHFKTRELEYFIGCASRILTTLTTLLLYL